MSEPDPLTRVGFVGLGAMGLPMARNLHTRGLLHRVWNRTTATGQEFARETGCAFSPDLPALGRECEAIVLCVSADADVLAVIDVLAASLRAGKLVIDCSTVSADTARAAAARLRGQGVDFLDCPVSGGTEGARNATLAIMVGGEPPAIERARPVLEALGRTVAHMGPVGAGQATKAANQIMVAGINQAVTEALAFAAAQDLPLTRVIEVLGSGAAGNWFLDHRGATMVQGQFPLGFKVALHQKDLEICRRMAAGMGAALPIVEMTMADYERLLERSHGEEDISALYRLKSALFDDGEAGGGG